MTAIARIPPGPSEPYGSGEDLLSWMQQNFQRYGDIYKATIYGGDVYVINAPEYAEYVLLRNWQNFLRKGQAVKRIALSLGAGLISSNGPLWAKQRRMIQPAFTREAVGSLWPVFLRPNVKLRERWTEAARAATPVNVTQDVSNIVLEVTLRAIFGEDYDRVAPQFQIVAEESRNLEFAQTCSALSKVIIDIAHERRARQRQASDILGTMMRSRDREGGRAMPDTQLAREALTLVIAGHETTASVLNWTWYLLSRHPEVEARLVGEICGLLGEEEPTFQSLGRFTYTRLVLEEALRTYPPLWLMTRKTVKPDVLGDYVVPAGTEIYISPYLLQRHPQLWRDPDHFDPERFAAGEDQQRLVMCPFGAGPRNCIGEFLARVEMQLHLMLIASRLQLRYDDPRPVGMVAGVNLLSARNFIMQPVLHNRQLSVDGVSGSVSSRTPVG